MTDMKHIKIGVITLLLFGIVLGLTGIVCADQGVPAVPETQGLVTGTTADIVGLATETDAGTWTLTNDPVTIYSYNALTDIITLQPGTYGLVQAQLGAAGGSVQAVWSESDNLWIVTQLNVPQSLLDAGVPGLPGATYQELINAFIGMDVMSPPTISGKGIHEGAIDPGQVQYTTAYDANIVAQAGHTVMTKSMSIDTRNKVIGQSNINAQTGLTYIATADGGNVVGSENLVLDGAGSATSSADRMLCPFAAPLNGTIPAYCNIVQAGSRYDLTIGSVTATANDKFVSVDASAPVVLNYNINVKPYGTTSGQIPAIGSTSAYIKAHIQEARTTNYVNVTAIMNDPREEDLVNWVYVPTTPQKTEDLTYSEASGAQGTITAFNKEMSYSSQVTGIAIATPVPTMTPTPPP
jgi:hypothetical protein